MPVVFAWTFPNKQKICAFYYVRNFTWMDSHIKLTQVFLTLFFFILLLSLFKIHVKQQRSVSFVTSCLWMKQSIPLFFSRFSRLLLFPEINWKKNHFHAFFSTSSLSTLSMKIQSFNVDIKSQQYKKRTSSCWKMYEAKLPRDFVIRWNFSKILISLSPHEFRLNIKQIS